MLIVTVWLTGKEEARAVLSRAESGTVLVVKGR